MAELTTHYGTEHLASTAGHRLTTQSIGPKMLWLRRHEPDIWRQTCYLCSASTFLVYRLTGEYVFDFPTAGFFDPLFNLQTLTWHDHYVAAIVGDKSLPHLQWVGEIAGTITATAASATGLAMGTPVTTGTLDAVADALSVGVTEPGDLMVQYGTTTFFITVVDQLPPPDNILWHTPYFAIEQLLPAQTIGASYGDAFMAGLACGLLPISALLTNWVRPSRHFVPHAHRHQHYQAYYQVYRDLYLHTADDLHTLARLGDVPPE